MRRSIDAPTEGKPGQDAPVCRIVVINDVLGTRVEVVSPQSVADAMKDNGPVCLALAWMAWMGCNYSVNCVPIGVALHRTDDTITVRWHVENRADPEEAKAAMRAVLDGTWREGVAS